MRCATFKLCVLPAGLTVTATVTAECHRLGRRLRHSAMVGGWGRVPQTGGVVGADCCSRGL